MQLKERSERHSQESSLCAASKWLANWVEQLAVPRNFWAEAYANRRIGSLIATALADWGYTVLLQGDYRNIVALPANSPDRNLVLIGAHYDSVPHSPGADDNASGVAVLLLCAQALAKQSLQVGFVAFNAEEDNLLGSRDFVSNGLKQLQIRPGLVHVLEMVGFRSYQAGSQRVPLNWLAKRFPVGDFIGIVGNRQAGRAINQILQSSALPSPRCVTLRQWIPLTEWLPDLRRSDHFPFWESQIPALLWTDTAEFRTPHYHRTSDLPETLDYEFMAEVANLLLASLLP